MPKIDYKVTGDVIQGYARKVVLYRFTMSDVEDPSLYAAEPIWQWQQTDHGKWCMENKVGELVFHTDVDYLSMGYRCVVVGDLREEDYTYHQLKWGQK
jgi:hypothetical protein